tara:strand:- start:283 stop:699 length:417 start_codon:yes stop_codon:yes gene_type:complete
MAKFINFPVTGGFSNINVPVSTPSMDGDNLLSAESIVSVSVAIAGIGGGANRMLVTLQLNGIAGSSVCTLTVGTSSTATPIGNLPAVATAARIKEAINKAITANPGGVKSTAVLPQDSAVNAAYAFGNTLYFKSFSIA